MDFEKKLEELFIELPEVPRVVKASLPAVLVGKMLYISGQLPFADGKLVHKGRLGLEVSLDQGTLAARYALLQALSAAKETLGSLNKIQKMVQLTGFVASGSDFKEQERVIDSASTLLQDIFGAAGKHARIVVGVNMLPQNACVELALIVETK